MKEPHLNGENSNWRELHTESCQAFMTLVIWRFDWPRSSWHADILLQSFALIDWEGLKFFSYYCCIREAEANVLTAVCIWLDAFESVAKRSSLSSQRTNRTVFTCRAMHVNPTI